MHKQNSAALKSIKDDLVRLRQIMATSHEPEREAVIKMIGKALDSEDPCFVRNQAERIQQVMAGPRKKPEPLSEPPEKSGFEQIMAEMNNSRTAPDPAHQNLGLQRESYVPPSERKEAKETYRFIHLSDGFSYLYHILENGKPEIVGKVDTSFSIDQEADAIAHGGAKGLEVINAYSERFHGKPGRERIVTFRRLEEAEHLKAQLMLIRKITDDKKLNL